MEADSRLNNDAMKGEGTVRFTQMTAVRRMYVHIHTVTGSILDKQHQHYIYCPIRQQNGFKHLD